MPFHDYSITSKLSRHLKAKFQSTGAGHKSYFSLADAQLVGGFSAFQRNQVWMRRRLMSAAMCIHHRRRNRQPVSTTSQEAYSAIAGYGRIRLPMIEWGRQPRRKSKRDGNRAIGMQRNHLRLKILFASSLVEAASHLRAIDYKRLRTCTEAHFATLMKEMLKAVARRAAILAHESRCLTMHRRMPLILLHRCRIRNQRLHLK